MTSGAVRGRCSVSVALPSEEHIVAVFDGLTSIFDPMPTAPLSSR